MFSGLPFRRRENVAATTPLVPEDRVCWRISTEELKALAGREDNTESVGRIVVIGLTQGVLRRILVEVAGQRFLTEKAGR